MKRFFKLSGAGNDFVALTGPAAPTAAEIRAWCRRGLSLGADGLFVLDRLEPGTVRMRYFNADGGSAALCVNGTRCAARLAFELGWAGDGDEVTIETGAGPARARRLGTTEIALQVPLPEAPPRAVEAEVEGTVYRGRLITVGVPHLVLAWPPPDRPPASGGGLADAPVATLGAALRRHPVVGADGANVDFVAERGAEGIAVRSYERGVEGETLACGSGVLAAAAVHVARGGGFPVRALTRGGFVLTVDGELERSPGSEPPRIRVWSLAGDARIVARGELGDEAAAVPETPIRS